MTDIPIYDVIINDDDIEQGLFAVSFVDYPAIEVDFLAMAEQKPMKVYLSKEKHEVVSPILIPNQLIYRRDARGEFYIRWSEEMIEQAAWNMLLNDRVNWVTDSHPMTEDPTLTYDEVLLDNVYMLRMWIIEDADTDDANTIYGYNLPNGTLMVHYKVLNEALWQKIVNGEVKGLSIEAVAELQRAE